MTVALELDSKQLKDLVLQCDMKEKTMLIDLLLKDTREERIKSFFHRQSELDLSANEIASELKAVRRAKRG